MCQVSKEGYVTLTLYLRESDHLTTRGIEVIGLYRLCRGVAARVCEKPPFTGDYRAEEFSLPAGLSRLHGDSFPLDCLKYQMDRQQKKG